MAGENGRSAIEAVLRPGSVDTSLFAPAFLQAVPPAQLQATLDQLTAELGPIVTVTERGGASYLVTTATHEMPVEIVLDASGRISGLQFRAAVRTQVSVEQLLADMQAVAPEFGLLVMRDGEALHAIAADRPLAVGSAFKLGVLKALSDEVAAGRRTWSDVVRLREPDLSLPSGTLQGWPLNSPLTLHTLAAMMISISDNTATDTLIHAIGRDAVENALGIAPVLTTRELFTLKAEPGMLSRYTTGNVEARRAVLTEIAEMALPDIAKVGTPYHPEAEWNLSATRLCELITSVAGIDVISINPGVANPSHWQHVAFKGGSEIGVLNLTTSVTKADGSVYCVAATWNAPQPIDQAAATSAYASLLAQLERN